MHHGGEVPAPLGYRGDGQKAQKSCLVGDGRRPWALKSWVLRHIQVPIEWTATMNHIRRANQDTCRSSFDLVWFQRLIPMSFACSVQGPYFPAVWLFSEHELFRAYWKAFGAVPFVNLRTAFLTRSCNKPCSWGGSDSWGQERHPSNPKV